ncbi:MAG: hypothetical protein LBQ80_00300 [Clostridium sp.]|jgi:hypothetical protein|nr:hypothetical protein [Clostridium sp.]
MTETQSKAPCPPTAGSAQGGYLRRGLSVYFRAALVITLLTAFAAGLLLVEDGTRVVEGSSERSLAVLSSTDKQISLLFGQDNAGISLPLPQYNPFMDLLPPPLGNAVWFFRAVTDAFK